MHLYAAWMLLGLTPSQIVIQPNPAPAPTPALPSPTFELTDEQILKDNKIATDGPGLLKFFRQRIARTADESRIKALIRQLGDDDFNQREDASHQLNALGLRAGRYFSKPFPIRTPRSRIGRKECLKEIDEGTAAVAVGAAVRTLAKLKPAGAAETLLRFLPSTAEETVAEEVRLSLAEIAVGNAKADAALAAALTDKSALQRAAAAFALGRAKVADRLPAVRKLLEDADPIVRYRAALGLAAARDKEAVPVLIGLLDKLPSAEAGRVEELLYRIADEKTAPPSPPSPRIFGRK